MLHHLSSGLDISDLVIILSLKTNQTNTSSFQSPCEKDIKPHCFTDFRVHPTFSAPAKRHSPSHKKARQASVLKTLPVIPSDRCALERLLGNQIKQRRRTKAKRRGVCVSPPVLSVVGNANETLELSSPFAVSAVGLSLSKSKRTVATV